MGLILQLGMDGKLRKQWSMDEAKKHGITTRGWHTCNYVSTLPDSPNFFSSTYSTLPERLYFFSHVNMMSTSGDQEHISPAGESIPVRNRPCTRFHARVQPCGSLVLYIGPGDRLRSEFPGSVPLFPVSTPHQPTKQRHSLPCFLPFLLHIARRNSSRECFLLLRSFDVAFFHQFSCLFSPRRNITREATDAQHHGTSSNHVSQARD
jgi:hypothetical protein